MKNIVCFIVVMILVFSIGTVFAADTVKPKVVVLFHETFAESQKLKQEPNKIFLDNLTQRLSNNYNVILDGGFSDKLNAAGLSEPILAERGDLIPIFRAENVDYVIIIFGNNYANNDVGYFSLYRYYLQIKVIDVSQNKYLFNGQLNADRKDGTTLVGRYLAELYVETENTLRKVMPELRK